MSFQANKKVIAKLREIEGRSIRKIQRERGVKIKFKSTEDTLERFTISREGSSLVSRKERSELRENGSLYHVAIARKRYQES